MNNGTRQFIALLIVVSTLVVLAKGSCGRISFILITFLSFQNHEIE